MHTLSPLETYYDAQTGSPLPMSAELERLYGQLAFPFEQARPYVITDFVQTIDGAVTLGVPGHEGGGDISGHNREDLMVLGLLRAVADAVIITSTSLVVGGNYLHVASEALPALVGEYRALRNRLGKLSLPLQVVVTGRGDIPADHRIFTSGEAPALVVTTEAGAQAARARGLAPSVPIAILKSGGEIGGQAIVDAVGAVLQSPSPLLLSEAGPHLFADLLAANCMDELFLTVAPQIAGRAGEEQRPGLVGDRLFAPTNPRWSELISFKRSSSFLFLRYRFNAV